MCHEESEKYKYITSVIHALFTASGFNWANQTQHLSFGITDYVSAVSKIWFIFLLKALFPQSHQVLLTKVKLLFLESSLFLKLLYLQGDLRWLAPCFVFLWHKVDFGSSILCLYNHTRGLVYKFMHGWNLASLPRWGPIVLMAVGGGAMGGWLANPTPDWGVGG